MKKYFVERQIPNNYKIPRIGKNNKKNLELN